MNHDHLMWLLAGVSMFFGTASILLNIYTMRRRKKDDCLLRQWEEKHRRMQDGN